MCSKACFGSFCSLLCWLRWLLRGDSCDVVYGVVVVTVV